jgi:vesicle transport through interaction with t-SNAREs protein 1
LARVKEHRSGLAKVKSDVRSAAAGASSGDAARAELGLDGSGSAGAGGFASSSATQRERLLNTTDRLNQTSDRIRQGRQTLLQTEELGSAILQDLHRQRQTITHSRDTLHTADDNIGRARKVLGSMSRRMTQNKILMAGVALILLICIIVILYCKIFSHC